MKGYTGKSSSKALILASTNPQYDKKLFIDSPVQYMKTTSSEHACGLVDARISASEKELPVPWPICNTIEF